MAIKTSKILSLMSEADKQRFWSKVDIGRVCDCWEWKACKTVDGYGRFTIGNRSNAVKRYSNRIAYTLFKNVDIESGLIVRHTCDNPSCCNPAHLCIGTHDNMLDMSNRDRSAVSFGAAKLNWDIVDEIRSSSEPRIVLQERYNVTKATISNILNNKTWHEEHRNIAIVTLSSL